MNISMNAIIEKLKEPESKCLVRKIIAFQSPVSGEVEYRVAYFLNYMEAGIWESDRLRLYNELKIDTTVHTDTIPIGEEYREI